MTQAIYRTWCPDLGQDDGDGCNALADSPAQAAEQCAAWADAYGLGEVAVADGAVRVVMVAAGLDEPVARTVTGYAGAVYTAVTADQHAQMQAEPPAPARGQIRDRARGELPPLPRPRRLTGTAYTTDGEVAIYTEQDLLALRRAAYSLGVQDQPTMAEMQERERRRADAESDAMARESAAYERSTGRKAHD